LTGATPLDNILSAIRLEEPERAPVTSLEQEHAVAEAAVTYREFATDSWKMASTHIRNVERYGWDWVWAHVDDWIEFEAMGNRIRFFNDNVPQVEEYLVKSSADIDKARAPDPLKDGRMPFFLKAIGLLSAKIGGRVMICGRVAAPFTAVTLMRGLTDGIVELYRDPPSFRKLLGIGLKVAEEFGKAQIEMGAHAIWIGDCMSSSRIIGSRIYEDYALPQLKLLISSIRSSGGIPILFTDERDPMRLGLEVSTEPDVLGIGTGIDMRVAKEEVGDRMCLLGNIDPLATLLRGSTDGVRAGVERCIRSCAPGGGYIVGTGECVVRHTPSDNLHAMVSAVSGIGKYPSRG
jgi:uroporphyrinogen decarboxylase